MFLVVTNDLYGRHISKFSNYNDLVNFLSNYNSPFGNDFLNKVKRNPSDDAVVIDYKFDCRDGIWGRYAFETKRYCEILDEHGNNAYNDKLVFDVINHTHNYYEYSRTKHITEEIAYNKKASIVKFRYDPIKGTGKTCAGCSPYRRISYVQAKKLAADPDAEDLIRASRNLSNLPDSWDLEPVRCYQRSWKVQGKNRKQWEAKVKRKKSDYTLDYDKRVVTDLDFDIQRDEVEEISEN